MTILQTSVPYFIHCCILFYLSSKIQIYLRPAWTHDVKHLQDQERLGRNVLFRNELNDTWYCSFTILIKLLSVMSSSFGSCLNASEQETRDSFFNTSKSMEDSWLTLRDYKLFCWLFVVVFFVLFFYKFPAQQAKTSILNLRYLQKKRIVFFY